MLRRSIAIAVFALSAAVPFLAPAMPVAAQTSGYQYELGFQTLHDMLPTIVGAPVENEWHNADNGDGLQRTTTGLLVWRKADNWTAFTDGSMTWINGPQGVATRPNSGPYFAWEAAVPAPNVPAAPVAVAPAAAAQLLVPSASAVEVVNVTNHDNERPRISLDVDKDRVDRGETFKVHVWADDRHGNDLEKIWWWATDTNDDRLRDNHTRDCHGDSSCSETWDEHSDDHDRTIRIHAKVRAENGDESEVTQDIHIR